MRKLCHSCHLTPRETISLVLAVLALFLLTLAFFTASPVQARNAETFQAMGWTQTDFTKKTIKLDEVASGGPPRDGIPSIDKPRFKPAKTQTHMGAQEPLIQITHKGVTRGYPLAILTWHEIVNDVIAGDPVAITYCPLCNAAIAFSRRHDGKVLEFGTSGLLRHSDLIMYDRQSDSWWQQFTGESIVGAYAGQSLTKLPVLVVSYESFLAKHPDADMLVPNSPRARPYGRNPYAYYDSQKLPFSHFIKTLPTDIAPMARVVVIEHENKVQAITLERLRRDKDIKLGKIIVRWRAGLNSALDHARISKGRDVGQVRVVLAGPEGEKDLVHDVTFAFAYRAFHPKGPLLQ